jgi:predicted metal-dependent peptidase
LPRKVLGGGGTSFIPVFERIEAEQLRPDVLVYFTDCFGLYPKNVPQYPVIWASITPEAQLGTYRPPFGEIVYVPLQKQSRYQYDTTDVEVRLSDNDDYSKYFG